MVAKTLGTPSIMRVQIPSIKGVPLHYFYNNYYKNNIRGTPLIEGPDSGLSSALHRSKEF